RDVRRPLDGRVAAKRHYAAAGAADVAEQELDDRGRADVLHADGVLRPPHRVDERAGALAAGIPADLLAEPEELVDCAAARVGGELRRVPGVVTPDDLEHAARVLQRLVPLRRVAVVEMRAAAALSHLLSLVPRALETLFTLARSAVRLHPLVAPRRDVVLALVGIPPGEEAVELVGVAELVGDDGRRVRVRLDVLLEVASVLDDVADHAAEERDVGARPDADVLRGHSA